MRTGAQRRPSSWGTCLAVLALMAVFGAGLGRGFATRTAQAARLQTDTSFAAVIARLSEEPGYFDSDNLISNESSYLHAVSKLRTLGTSGGAYIGVGPDQNFSYIAALRPSVAFILDIRRENLLLHLFYKALFQRSRNRLEYLLLWMGRPVPADIAAWSDSSIEAIVARVDSSHPDSHGTGATTDSLIALVESYGVPLSDTDRATLRRFHQAFIGEGLDIRYTSIGRAPRPYYPTLRRLILERDLEGKQSNYLASRQAWEYVKWMQAEDRIIPVTGDLGGTHALRAIGQEIAARGQLVSAFYVSNVEMYLWRDGGFDRYAQSVSELPRDSRSALVRSVFSGGFGVPHRQQLQGHASTQLVQTLEDFAERWQQRLWRSYWDLVTQGNR
ncbi:MAG TPA: hypothetical protein VNL96_08640 [Gemmatimonadaceae bacterium]|nr:hypothetical protein [Gemmatimonadaceae bacterium]